MFYYTPECLSTHPWSAAEHADQAQYKVLSTQDPEMILLCVIIPSQLTELSTEAGVTQLQLAFLHLCRCLSVLVHRWRSDNSQDRPPTCPHTHTVHVISRVYCHRQIFRINLNLTPIKINEYIQVENGETYKLFSNSKKNFFDTKKKIYIWSLNIFVGY